MKEDILNKLYGDIPDWRKKLDKYSYSIASTIISELKEKGMTQKDLSEKLGKEDSLVSRWISGNHNFTLKTICEIEDALDIKILYTYNDVSDFSKLHERSSSNDPQRNETPNIVKEFNPQVNVNVGLMERPLHQIKTETLLPRYSRGNPTALKDLYGIQHRADVLINSTDEHLIGNFHGKRGIYRKIQLDGNITIVKTGYGSTVAKIVSASEEENIAARGRLKKARGHRKRGKKR